MLKKKNEHIWGGFGFQKLRFPLVLAIKNKNLSLKQNATRISDLAINNPENNSEDRASRSQINCLIMSTWARCHEMGPSE